MTVLICNSRKWETNKSGRKKFAKNNCHFTILSGRNAARLIAFYKKPSSVFLSSLAHEENVLLHFHAFRGKREREHTSISVEKQIHLVAVL